MFITSSEKGRSRDLCFMAFNRFNEVVPRPPHALSLSGSLIPSGCFSFFPLVSVVSLHFIWLIYQRQLPITGLSRVKIPASTAALGEIRPIGQSWRPGPAPNYIIVIAHCSHTATFVPLPGRLGPPKSRVPNMHSGSDFTERDCM